MRAVIQRVKQASVSVNGAITGQIGAGLLALIGVQKGDTQKDAQYIADKIRKLRIFEDADEKMNLSIEQTSKCVLAVSQFTLLGDVRGQNRPGFTQAELPEEANVLYEQTVEYMRNAGLTVQTGVFRTHMEVSLINDGPVTILIDSKKDF